MKKHKFLNKLKQEEKLELVELSDEICESYIDKSNDCLTSAKLLLQNGLHENSITMSYYSMYNSLLALLFKNGIKCENHSGSILLLRFLFENEDLFKIISNAKEERIDKQYYVTTDKDEITKEVAEELFNNAEDFVVKIKLLIQDIGNDSIVSFREKFEII